jgi:hypothetical protein
MPMYVTLIRCTEQGIKTFKDLPLPPTRPRSRYARARAPTRALRHIDQHDLVGVFLRFGWDPAQTWVPVRFATASPSSALLLLTTKSASFGPSAPEIPKLTCTLQVSPEARG